MKKVILAAVALISVVFAGTAHAQSKTDNVTVNIKLKPIHTLVVNAGQKIVDLVYTTEDDYNDGVASPVLADHLKIFSTGAFEIQVKTGGNFESNPSGESIDASSVTVTPSAGTTKASTGAVYTEKTLSNSDQQIISNTAGGRDLTVNVKYAGAGADAYINKFSKSRGVSENVFTAQVTYTILAL